MCSFTGSPGGFSQLAYNNLGETNKKKKVSIELELIKLVKSTHVGEWNWKLNTRCLGLRRVLFWFSKFIYTKLFGLAQSLHFVSVFQTFTLAFRLYNCCTEHLTFLEIHFQPPNIHFFQVIFDMQISFVYISFWGNVYLFFHDLQPSI